MNSVKWVIKMKRGPFFTILTIIVFAGVFFACGQDESKTELPPGTTQIIGAGATFRTD